MQCHSESESKIDDDSCYELFLNSSSDNDEELNEDPETHAATSGENEKTKGEKFNAYDQNWMIHFNTLKKFYLECYTKRFQQKFSQVGEKAAQPQC